MTEEKAKSLIGRKVRGFKFDDFTDDISYHPSMDEYIGKVGSIIDISLTKNFIVAFNNYTWSYPASLIEAHLVEEDWELKIEDLETDTSEIDQLKADKEELVKALEDFISGIDKSPDIISLIDSGKIILQHEYEQAKQTLEKHGK